MNDTQNIAAIILCAGKGVRAGGTLAKQWQVMSGKRVIDWTLEKFTSHPEIGQIVVVHPRDAASKVSDLRGRPLCVPGGDTRTQSVQNGLAALAKTAPDVVLIHDGARPCVTHDVLTQCIVALRKHRAAACAIPVTDTLWRGAEGRVGPTVDRTDLFHAQTPQGFDYPMIVAAHHAFNGTASDDVQVAQAAGMQVVIVPGDADNIKITTQGDFARAERILAKR